MQTRHMDRTTPWVSHVSKPCQRLEVVILPPDSSRIRIDFVEVAVPLHVCWNCWHCWHCCGCYAYKALQAVVVAIGYSYDRSWVSACQRARVTFERRLSWVCRLSVKTVPEGHRHWGGLVAACWPLSDSCLPFLPHLLLVSLTFCGSVRRFYPFLGRTVNSTN